jgi:hypothetical protein
MYMAAAPAYLTANLSVKLKLPASVWRNKIILLEKQIMKQCHTRKINLRSHHHHIRWYSTIF